MSQLEGIIIRPCVTEKNTFLTEKYNQYVFEVAMSANKFVIEEAIEKIFKVKVKMVRTLTIRGKVKRLGRSMGKRPNWKKAVVTLMPGQKIELFKGV